MGHKRAFWTDVSRSHNAWVARSNHIKRRTGIERDKFYADLDILNLQNGLLNINSGEFREHTANEFSLVQLTVKYNPNAKCPNILKFLGQVLKPKDVFTALEESRWQRRHIGHNKLNTLLVPGQNLTHFVRESRHFFVIVIHRVRYRLLLLEKNSKITFLP